MARIKKEKHKFLIEEPKEVQKRTLDLYMHRFFKHQRERESIDQKFNMEENKNVNTN